MFECQEELKRRIAELEAEAEAYRHKIKMLIHAQDTSRALMRDAYHDFEKCPVCGKKFRAVRYVDVHIQKVHPSHLFAWKSPRIDRPVDPDVRVRELEDELANLRALMNEPTRKFAECLNSFNQRLRTRERPPERHITVEHFEFQPKKQPEPVPPRPPCPKVPITQRIIQLSREDSEDDIGSTDAVDRVRRKAVEQSARIRVGFASNYVTPEQVAGILRYDNTAYQRLMRTARDQFDTDIPMRRRPGTRRAIESESGSDNSTSESGPRGEHVTHDAEEEEEEEDHQPGHDAVPPSQPLLTDAGSS
jgi:uncharacterized C2H2 Zn-finger protein